MHIEPVIVVQLQWKWIELRREEARKAKVARVARMAKVAKVTGVFLGEQGRGFGGRGRGQGKGKKGKGRGNANKGKGKQKGKKGGGKTKDKGKVGQNQCKLCFAYGHWSGECPSKMDVNYVAQGQQNSNGFEATMNPAGQHTGTASSSTTYVQQPPVEPQASTKGIVRRIFHINPSSPSSPTSPISSGSQKHVRMVLLEEVPEEFENMELVTQRVETQDGEEWIILDSGSDVSLLPSRFSADRGTQSNHSLRNCQGGALRTRGTRNADLEVRSTEGEEILLRHQFIIGDVTTGLVSLGQLYQAGWKICGDGDELVLTDPNDEVNIPGAFPQQVICNSSTCSSSCMRRGKNWTMLWKFEQWSQSMMRSKMRRLTAGEQLLMEDHFTKPWGPTMSILEMYGVGITSIAQPSFEYMVEKIEIGSWSSSLRSSCRRTEGGSVWLYRRVLD